MSERLWLVSGEVLAGAEKCSPFLTRQGGLNYCEVGKYPSDIHSGTSEHSHRG